MLHDTARRIHTQTQGIRTWVDALSLPKLSLQCDTHINCKHKEEAPSYRSSYEPNAHGMGTLKRPAEVRGRRYIVLLQRAEGGL